MQAWTKHISAFESLMNGITALINLPLYHAGCQAKTQVQTGVDLSWTLPEVQHWSSVYSGIGVISNRETLPHKDPGAWPEAYDLLCSIGRHTEARLVADEVGSSFLYNPGCVVGICGRIVQHACTEWTGSDRVCMAHFFKKTTLDRLEIPCTSWVPFSDYTALMDPGFVDRQK